MPKQFLHKVKFLCKTIPEVEWSGVLFYSYKGDISNPQTFKINLEDILPLDKGTTAFTEYELDERFINYLDKNPERMMWSVGHIHSHHSMSVFFSGTDKAELNDNAFSHNFYLSLIVNNFMDFTAKVGIVAGTKKSMKQQKFFATNDKGISYVVDTEDLEFARERLYVYDCEIFSEAEQINVPEEFMANVAEILKPKVVKQVIHTATPVKNLPASTIPTYGKVPEAYRQQLIKLENRAKYYKPDLSKASKRSKALLKVIEDTDFSVFEDMGKPMSEMEKFVAKLMKFGTELDHKEHLEDVLNLLEDLELDAYQLATSITTLFPIVYDSEFENCDDEQFIRDCDEITDILNDYVNDYPFINVTIEAIENIAIEYEKSYARTTI